MKFMSKMQKKCGVQGGGATIVQTVVAEVVAKLGRRLHEPRIPQWLCDLPAGQYTVKELMAISGTTQKNVSKVMNHYCINIEFVESQKSHMRKCVYHWD